jgi:hypothetical protein
VSEVRFLPGAFPPRAQVASRMAACHIGSQRLGIRPARQGRSGAAGSAGPVDQPVSRFVVGPFPAQTDGECHRTGCLGITGMSNCGAGPPPTRNEVAIKGMSLRTPIRRPALGRGWVGGERSHAPACGRLEPSRRASYRPGRFRSGFETTR